MARLSEKLIENAAGEFYVDRTCIDCDACRQIAPAVFARSDREQQSYVHRQPADLQERHRALMALVACPTASIGTAAKTNATAAARSFPEPVQGEVYYCGYAAESSFGASSYFIRRPEGNVLVDSPRAAGPLVKRLTELGGVRWMFLTHRDDVADHQLFARAFACERVLHRDDLSRPTAGVERIIDGAQPVRLADDLLVIPVPGHTRGSSALLYRDTFLFTGDHLWGMDEQDALDASREVCWYSWPEQMKSLAKLLEFRFGWVLPGHGRRFRAESPEVMRDKLAALLERLGQPGVRS
jgi:glyoxylase-like metal-dependent hydrolase (beta-lactamase superfamily II)/ferredoxin